MDRETILQLINNAEENDIDSYLESKIEPFLEVTCGLIKTDDNKDIGFIKISSKNLNPPYVIKEACGKCNRIEKGDIFIRKGYGYIDELVKVKVILEDTDGNTYESNQREIMMIAKGDVLHKVRLNETRNKRQSLSGWSIKKAVRKEGGNRHCTTNM